MNLNIGINYRTVCGVIAKIYEICETKYIGAILIRAEWYPQSWSLTGTSYQDSKYDIILSDSFEITNTKLLPGYVKIDYCNLSLSVKSKYKYISTDKNGEIFAYVNEPCIVTKSSIEWSENRGDCEILAKVDFIGNWKKSLMVIENIIIER